MTDSDVNAAFSTPLVIRRFPRNGEFNRKLAEHILDWERREGNSIGRSNFGGWHSPDMIMQHDLPEIAQLRNIIAQAIRDATLKFATEEPHTSDVWMMGWANVLREGSYNRLHNHHPAGWSAVYYVQVGESTLDDSLSGVIEFVDPRPGINAAKLPGAPFDQKVRVVPEDGLLLLFPAWLKHIVYPYRGKTTRISIAVNINFQKDPEIWDEVS
ncbi:MAG: TIGR02466 family protein [Rhodovibrionaceae bacterium]